MTAVLLWGDASREGCLAWTRPVPVNDAANKKLVSANLRAATRDMKRTFLRVTFGETPIPEPRDPQDHRVNPEISRALV